VWLAAPQFAAFANLRGAHARPFPASLSMPNQAGMLRRHRQVLVLPGCIQARRSAKLPWVEQTKTRCYDVRG
jgi:hypothetical protein